MFNCLSPHGLKHARLPCPSPSPWVCSNSCPSSRWCHPTISSSVRPLPLPTFNLSQHQGLFKWVSSSHQMAKVWSFSSSFSISPSNEYSVLISFRTDWFDFLAVQGTLKNLPSLAPQFESISYSELSLLYGPTLSSIHDYWKKKNRFDYMDLCQQSDISGF